jgi:hypothetical protein
MEFKTTFLQEQKSFFEISLALCLMFLGIFIVFFVWDLDWNFDWFPVNCLPSIGILLSIYYFMLIAQSHRIDIEIDELSLCVTTKYLWRHSSKEFVFSKMKACELYTEGVGTKLLIIYTDLGDKQHNFELIDYPNKDKMPEEYDKVQQLIHYLESHTTLSLIKTNSSF